VWHEGGRAFFDESDNGLSEKFQRTLRSRRFSSWGLGLSKSRFDENNGADQRRPTSDRVHEPIKRWPKPNDRTALLASRRALKMMRSAHAYVRGNASRFYEWVETQAHGKLARAASMLDSSSCISCVRAAGMIPSALPQRSFECSLRVASRFQYVDLDPQSWHGGCCSSSFSASLEHECMHERR